MRDIQEPGRPVISPVRFARRLDIEQQKLAQLARVHRNTLTRLPEAAKLQGFLQQAVRVLAAASDRMGNTDRALYWFRSHPIRDFDYNSPLTLVAEGRADEVLRYIERLGVGNND